MERCLGAGVGPSPARAAVAVTPPPPATCRLGEFSSDFRADHVHGFQFRFEAVFRAIWRNARFYPRCGVIHRTFSSPDPLLRGIPCQKRHSTSGCGMNAFGGVAAMNRRGGHLSQPRRRLDAIRSPRQTAEFRRCYSIPCVLSPASHGFTAWVARSLQYSGSEQPWQYWAAVWGRKL